MHWVVRKLLYVLMHARISDPQICQCQKSITLHNPTSNAITVIQVSYDAHCVPPVFVRADDNEVVFSARH